MNFLSPLIRPYSLTVFPEHDRVLTTSFSMHLEEAKDLIQIWRLSDLSLLGSLDLPASPAARAPECSLAEAIETPESCSWDRLPGHRSPFEIRRLEDGSALLNTFHCGFYRIDGIGEEEPSIELVLNLYAQADPASDRVVVTGVGPAGSGVRLYRLDRTTGELVPDAAFGDGGVLRMESERWPHGGAGIAMPHAALFGGR